MLREKCRQLEQALHGDFVAPFEWGLSPHQTRCFGVLLNRAMASNDAFMAALYHDDGREPANPKIVDVMVCHIRRKLKPFGIRIYTVWGQGYAIPEEQRRRLLQGESDLRPPELITAETRT